MSFRLSPTIILVVDFSEIFNVAEIAGLRRRCDKQQRQNKGCLEMAHDSPSNRFDISANCLLSELVAASHVRRRLR
jgi:hypothetical protein